MTDTDAVPSLYEWAGGMPAFERLTEVFYQRVPQDPLLAPLFARMDPAHAQHVAHFIAEVFGGPPRYSGERGGHTAMLGKHLGKHLNETQRGGWMALLLECADLAGLPDDPEFRSAFVGYIEWGTRLALINSRSDQLPPHDAAMPQWNWGAAKGPYRGE